MKTKQGVWAFLLFLTVTAPTLATIHMNAAGDGFQVRISFPEPQWVESAPGQFVPNMEGLLSTMEGGRPSVPVKLLKIALPPGKILELVRHDRPKVTHTRRVIAPNAPQLPISWMNSKSNSPSSWDEVSFLYPRRMVQADLQTLHGVHIVLLKLYPIQTVVGAPETTYSQRLDVELRLKASHSKPVHLSSFQRHELALR